MIKIKIPLRIRILIGPYIHLIYYFIKIVFLKNRIIPNVISPEETLDKIINKKLSVIRFGDGEISLIKDKNLAFQNRNEKLKLKLIDILKIKNEKLIICIPGIFEKINNFSNRSFWFTLHHLFNYEKDWIKLTKNNNSYGNSFITRPYLVFKDKGQAKKNLERIIKIWDKKDVILIEGSGTRMGVGNDLFKNTKSLKRILCPSENAFDKYEEIKKEAIKIDKEKLILISLGPTAKVLAYDLFLLGYRVIDIGHLDMEYEMFLRNSEKIVKIPYKYFNEINEREPEKCDDKTYLEQIIIEVK